MEKPTGRFIGFKTYSILPFRAQNLTKCYSNYMAALHAFLVTLSHTCYNIVIKTFIWVR